MTSKTWRVRVLKGDRPTNFDPIRVQAGDQLEIAGKEDDGWIWCRYSYRQGGLGATELYDSRGRGKHTNNAL